ncbi:hypothetical protein VFPPC_17577 [Pochonia chlamydosporia 170]|uniref:Uncharacterized protein n=1 Tax=Pochonia chlamydosporia 170 TaxID=1380566 RepID=A0A219AR68_METCM|nr:hypothetical protein VFPPC_17577 [Pochonia chlamydosporia 170]OWT43260.1 hypothetical protein VFPPC_17577 [Pochonia chlamydosporia 170]
MTESVLEMRQRLQRCVRWGLESVNKTKGSGYMHHTNILFDPLSTSHAHQIASNCGDMDPHGPSLPMFLPCVIQPVIHAVVSHDGSKHTVSSHDNPPATTCLVICVCCFSTIGCGFNLSNSAST